MPEIRIVELDPMRAAYFRSAKGYDPAAIQEAFGRLGRHFQASPPAGETLVLGLSWDDPQSTPADRCRYDAAFSFTGDAPTGVDGVHDLSRGTFVHYRYVGPYDGMGEAFADAHKQLRALGGYRMRDGACIEIYRNDPAKTPPAELVTDIYLPVAKA
jgi:AraC family transcriptional regulator